MPDNGDIDENEVPKKRKTTYNREHPTDNPKPPKRTKGEIQAAAAEKRAAAIAKKKELADIQLEKKEKALKVVAAAEDAVQRQQRQRQLQAERPDLQTKKTYRTIKEVRTITAGEGRAGISPPPGDVDQDESESSDIEMPPQSTVDTDSDGGLLGRDNLNAEPESEGEEDSYLPATDENDENEEDEEAEFSDASDEPPGKTSKKKRSKKKDTKGKLRADIRVHREIATPVYAPVDAQGRMQEGRKRGKPTEIGGLQKNWKERAQPHSHRDTSSVPKSTLTKGGQQQAAAASSRPDSGEESENQVPAPPTKKQQTTAASTTPSQIGHHGGTKASGIKLSKAGPQKAINLRPGQRAAKPRYNNNHLPFENINRDLRTWRDAVLPAIIDWAGTLEDGFGVNAHPDLQEIIQYNWNEEFPSTECDEAVLSVASSAIRNWRSSIGKYALRRLTKLFAEEPYKSWREYRKDYVTEQLQDLRYIYRDPDTKSGAYRSPVIIEIYAVHQQLVSKTDKFYGYPGGALSLCAAAHERALKLWRSGDPPDKDTKTSFVRRPWAIRAAAHFQTIKKLSESKWIDIVEAANSVIESRNDEFDPTGDNDSELDDPDEVLISEDEATISN